MLDIENAARSLREREPHISINVLSERSTVRPGTPRYFEEVAENATRLWRQEFESRNGRVITVVTEPVYARHNHEPTDALIEGCLACTLEKRKLEGLPPAVRVLVKVMRDLSPVQLVEVPVPAKLHKLRRGMKESYHLRVQKKWNKQVSGKTQLSPAQETVTLSMSKAAYRAVLDYDLSLKKNRRHS